MSIFKKCKHEWEVIVNEYEKSQMEKTNKTIEYTGFGSIDSILHGKKIIILQCKKCGKLNKTIEKI